MAADATLPRQKLSPSSELMRNRGSLVEMEVPSLAEKLLKPLPHTALSLVGDI